MKKDGTIQANRWMDSVGEESTKMDSANDSYVSLNPGQVNDDETDGDIIVINYGTKLNNRGKGQMKVHTIKTFTE